MRLLRGDIQELRRSSLDSEEAEALNQRIARALGQMEKQVSSNEATIKEYSQAIAAVTQNTADKAIREEFAKSREEFNKIAKDLADATGEARKQAWHYFGGFWVWLASMLLLGFLVGVASISWIRGNSAAKDFGKHPSIYCESAGGQKTEDSGGNEICVFWLE